MKPIYALLIFTITTGSIFLNGIVNAQEFRSIDGWLNNPDHFWGAAFTHVQYPSPVTYDDGFATPTGVNRPNPRTISSLLFSQEGLVSDPNGLNALVWVFGQFIDHDITLSPDHPHEEMDIPVPAFDPYFDPVGTGQAVIPMHRSDYDRTTGFLPGFPRRHFNATTSYIDGSTVYGPDQERANWLRTFRDGKLKTSEGNMLPYNTEDGEYDTAVDTLAPEMAMPFRHVSKYYVAGDERANENPLLTSIHTIFVREHNRYCDELKNLHPDWDDESLYQYARKYVGAMIEAIVYEEWLPLLGIHISDYAGYDRKVNPSMMNEFVTAAYRYGHTTITPILIRLDHDGKPHPDGDVALRHAFFNPEAISSEMGVEPYLMGAVVRAQQKVDCKVIDELRNFLFGAPGSGGLDLVALNINRGRDRGLLDYNHLRTYFGLPLLSSFDQMTGDPLMQAGLEDVYGDIDDIDAWVGMLAEDHVEGSMFGPTASAIIKAQFSALRDGDRFYYENDNYLTADEKIKIKHTRLAQILRRNAEMSIFPDEAFSVTTFDPILVRSYDGKSNNEYNPDWGSKDARVVGRIAPAFSDGISEPSGPDRPNPRAISNGIFSQSTAINDALNLSAYAWGWGQFIDHDITLSPDHPSERFDISVPAYDAFFDPAGTGQAVIPMNRSDYVSGSGTSRTNPRAYYNGITAFIDASAVYGSDEERASWLRTYEGGKLKVSAGNLLPYNTYSGEKYDALDPDAPEMAMPLPHVTLFFVAGDVRANENPFLTSIHTLFVREHNRLCDSYQAQFPEWTDEQIYQHARKMVGGYMEAIVYYEWLPTLGISLPDYTGYKADVNPGIMNVFSTAAYRYGHSTIGDDFVVMDKNGEYMPGGDDLRLRDLFFNPGAISEETNGIEGFLGGMSTIHTQEFDCHVIDDLRNFLFGPPGAGGLDLVAMNVNRGRDRGLPDYNSIRDEMGLSRINTFSQLSADPILNQHFAVTYGDVDLIDVWAGMLAEEHMQGSLFGRTAQTIIGEQFTNIRDGDRFFFEVDPVLSETEKIEIRNIRLSDIIRRNTLLEFILDEVFRINESTTGIEEDLTELALQIYPNPSTVSLSCSLSNENLGPEPAMVEIFDMYGRRVWRSDLILTEPDQLVSVDVEALPSQSRYLLHIRTDNRSFTGQFVKL